MITDNIADLTEREARIAWSTIIEPGEEIAGRFIAEHDSAHQALITVVHEVNLDEFHKLDAEYLDAIARWAPRARNWNSSLLRVVRQMAQFGIGFVQPGDEQWPAERLARLGFGEPIGLYTRGSGTLLVSDSVGVVGARAATGYGEHVTVGLVDSLVGMGITVISGGAYGIDGRAHRSVIDAGGFTIAIMAGGLDRYYPSGHTELLTKVAERGLVISEMPPGSPPTKNRFLQRNRLIAALSEYVLVVEAGVRSGSLNTAHHAERIGVPVGAVPGPVTSAASDGCHDLIKRGIAKIVTSADDVQAVLRGE